MPPQLCSEKYSVKPVSPQQMRDSDIIIKDQDGSPSALEVSDFAYSNSELVNFENAAVNIDNSSDVIIGPVTQFNVNGNITIVQNGASDGEEKDTEKAIYEQKFPQKCENGIRICGQFIRKKQNLIMVIFFSFTLALSTLLLLIILLVIRDVEPPPDDDQFQTPIFLDRDQWGGRVPRNITKVDEPVKIVVMRHTSGPFCLTTAACKEITRDIQDKHFHMGLVDISYNFLVGGDGNIYVGRGFGVKNYESNRTIDIALYGNYLFDTFYPYMINTTKFLLHEGLVHNFIAPDYVIICQNQTSKTSSTADHIYQEIMKWDHFSNHTYYDFFY